ncbi:hypothetical protein [Sinisalibacter aestuarii]|uniref:Uncharacterized protein n=1 Tax=Sinisalibacter aestuarii TaxID=2949426 RepID=A0ABQ5LQN2_9RHOB|nr:hypothetical protein [Sinisalibacter aestuarii]GKY87320.1 hypothetical protein STA1M1_11890 [Sinisalibacter aestuarii]
MGFELARRLGVAVGAVGVAAALAAPVFGQGIPAPDAATLDAQWQVYAGDTVPSVVEFSPMRATQEVALADGGTLRLTSLHPGVNRWYLLERRPAEGQGRAESWHFENGDAATWFVSLTGGADPALLIEGAGDARECRPWAGETSDLATAAGSGLPYAPVCGGRLYLRNKVSGSRTNREAVSDFLRKNVVFGDKLVNLIKGTFFEDAFLESAALGGEEDDTGAVVAALGQADLDRRPLMRTAMGLPVEGAPDGMEAGSWYVADGQEGVFASVMQPGLISAEILKARNGANWFDGVEQNADVYLVAFDLGRFDVGYELGTDHPGLEWSSRPQRSGIDWNIPGPDGFARPDPLVRNGMLSPALTPRVVAGIAGGFKRDHGAFRFSDYAGFNRGHHYGFISNGVTFSRMIENLATLYVTVDGEVGMKTWQEADNAMIPRLAYARQNGVSVVERDPGTGASVPGPRVTSWGGGNWSGSAEAQLRTLRSGACLRESGGRKFLIYAYFSSVTPSAMARVFQAYECDYGMLLDMNSPELTYMALYRQNEAGDGLVADHLSRPMAESDPWLDGSRVPRFVTFSDNRDFIYLLRKE